MAVDAAAVTLWCPLEWKLYTSEFILRVYLALVLARYLIVVVLAFLFSRFFRFFSPLGDDGERRVEAEVFFFSRTSVGAEP